LAPQAPTFLTVFVLFPCCCFFARKFWSGPDKTLKGGVEGGQPELFFSAGRLDQPPRGAIQKGPTPPSPPETSTAPPPDRSPRGPMPPPKGLRRCGPIPHGGGSLRFWQCLVFIVMYLVIESRIPPPRGFPSGHRSLSPNREVADPPPREEGARSAVTYGASCFSIQ